jgi:hypothetical protein
MAPAESSRQDLNLTQDQRSTIEPAAMTTTTVPAARWEEFLALLDQGLDPRTVDLLAQTPIWERP